MSAEEIDRLSASETAALVSDGSLSPVEVTRAAIARIERRNPSLNAVIYTDFEAALGQARSLEQAIRRGEPAGPLAGVPMLVKDTSHHRAGWPSTLGGIPALKDNRAKSSSATVERLERSGAILLGKSNAPLLGFRGTTDNPLFGPTRNPFDTARNSGGSSGGSAAAVADGIVPAASATDGGGSIRIPASWCGLVGFQASFGSVPMVLRPDAFSAIAPFLYNGVVTRTVGDTALCLAALQGHDPRDPLFGGRSIDLLGALEQPIEGLRIGVTADFGIFPVESGVRDKVLASAARFAQAGARVEPLEIDLPADQRSLSDLWCRMVSSNSVAAFRELEAAGIDLMSDHRGELPEPLVHWAEIAARMTLPELQQDQILRSAVLDRFLEAFERHDLIVAPTTACTAVSNAETIGETLGPSAIEGSEVDPLIGWCLTYLTNLTGHPSVSLPAGLLDGLPVGLMIIGPRNSDDVVMAVAAAFERLRPWSEIYEVPARRPLH